MAVAQTEAMAPIDLEHARAARFFNRLRSHAFVAILVDEDANPAIVRMYTKGVPVNKATLSKIRDLLDELEKELNGNKE